MPENNGSWLYERIQEQLRHDWEELRELYANSKGDTYEESLAEFLRSYFGGVYDISTKAAVIDQDLKCFEKFDFVTGDDEIDVVASFSQAKPRIIFETGDERAKLRWIPFEAVAFICEVKSRLSKQSLEKDFKKLRSVSDLSEALDSRFGPSVRYDYSISDPLQCLVYDGESIADATLSEILLSNYSHWHLLLIVQNDVLLMNRNLPLSENFVPSSDIFGHSKMPQIPPEMLAAIEAWPRVEFDADPDIISLDNGLFWFLITLSASIPDPLAVNTVESLNALSDGMKFKTYAATEVGEEN